MPEPVWRVGCRQDRNIYRDNEYAAVAFAPETAAAFVAAMNAVGDYVAAIVRQEAEIVRLRHLVDEQASRLREFEATDAIAAPSPAEDATPTVRWFCRDADGRETFLDGDEEYARAHQAGFANLTPESRCVLIRRTLTPGGSVISEEEIDV